MSRKIFFIHDRDDQSGGASQVLLAEVAALKKCGFDVFTFHFSRSKHFVGRESYYKETAFKPVRILYKLTLDPILILRLKKLIRNVNPDIIHIHNNHYYPLSVYLALPKEKPVVHTVHDYSYFPITKSKVKEGSLAQKLISACLYFREKTVFTKMKKLDLLIVPSKTLAGELKHLGFQNVIQIYNSVDLNKFIPNKIQKDKNILLYAGVLEQPKGVNILVQAMPSVLRCFPNIQLYLVGHGSYQSKLLNLIRKLGIEKNVNFTGKVSSEDIVKYFQQSKIYILPSVIRENNPITILESFACGTPVIASNSGGNPELVKDGFNGYLFEPGSSSELSQKIIKLLKSPRLLEDMCKRARKTAEKYSIATHISNLQKAYKKAIDN